LPPTAAAPAVLQCTAVASAGAAPGGPGWFAGFGIRKAGQRDPMGFWVIRPDGARLQRVAINTLGLSGKVRCQAPEVGD